MKASIVLLALGFAGGLAPAASFAATPANDYPTLDRVEYVLACARDGAGSPRENIYKCTCAIDAIAARLTYDEYIEFSTSANAISIGGERGEVMRGYTQGKDNAGKYRKVQAEARQACFLR